MNNNARKPDNPANPGDRPKPEDMLEPTDLADVSLGAPEPLLPFKQPTSKETEKGDTKIDEFEIRRKRFFELK